MAADHKLISLEQPTDGEEQTDERHQHHAPPHRGGRRGVALRSVPPCGLQQERKMRGRALLRRPWQLALCPADKQVDRSPCGEHEQQDEDQGIGHALIEWKFQQIE